MKTTSNPLAKVICQGTPPSPDGNPKLMVGFCTGVLNPEKVYPGRIFEMVTEKDNLIMTCQIVGVWTGHIDDILPEWYAMAGPDERSREALEASFDAHEEAWNPAQVSVTFFYQC